MTQQKAIKLYKLLLLCYVWFGNFETGLFLEIGSCSTTVCQGNSTNKISSSKVLNYCSCSSGCFIYQDCCCDSPHRNDKESPSVRFIRISVSNKADYKAVAQCSESSKDSAGACIGNIGILPPVTSKLTGITYANEKCATCNEDSEQLVTWEVTLSCCPEHDNAPDETGRRFGYIRRTLYSILPGSKAKCECKYNASEEDGSLDKLELRTYDPRDEISRCSPTWSDKSTRNKCYSFIEPVYTRNKAYRNLHCAKCNYESMEQVHHQPDIVRSMLLDGQTEDAIYSHCVKNLIRDCVHYFGNKDIGRGKPFGLRDVLNIDFRECVPPPGRKCCKDHRFDSISKKCRKIAEPSHDDD